MHRIIAIIASIAVSSQANALEGVFNTGPSLEPEANGASLDVSFHPCKDDENLICASVLRVVNADPNANDNLPDGSPIVGYTFVRDLQEKKTGKLRKGKITAIDESIKVGTMKNYGLKIDVRDDGDLEAKGCLGMICPRTMIWTAVTLVE